MYWPNHWSYSLAHCCLSHHICLASLFPGIYWLGAHGSITMENRGIITSRALVLSIQVGSTVMSRRIGVISIKLFWKDTKDTSKLLRYVQRNVTLPNVFVRRSSCSSSRSIAKRICYFTCFNNLFRYSYLSPWMPLSDLTHVGFLFYYCSQAAPHKAWKSETIKQDPTAGSCDCLYTEIHNRKTARPTT